MLATWTRRPLPTVVMGLPTVFAVGWVLFFASGTPSGAAILEPKDIAVTSWVMPMLVGASVAAALLWLWLNKTAGHEAVDASTEKFWVSLR